MEGTMAKIIHPTPQEWVGRALAGHPIWAIGQLDAATERALDREVRAGRLEKRRGHFCGLLPAKTVWCLPDTPSLHGSHFIERKVA